MHLLHHRELRGIVAAAHDVGQHDGLVPALLADHERALLVVIDELPGGAARARSVRGGHDAIGFGRERAHELRNVRDVQSATQVDPGLQRRELRESLAIDAVHARSIPASVALAQPFLLVGLEARRVFPERALRARVEARHHLVQVGHDRIGADQALDAIVVALALEARREDGSRGGEKQE